MKRRERRQRKRRRYGERKENESEGREREEREMVDFFQMGDLALLFVQTTFVRFLQIQYFLQKRKSHIVKLSHTLTVSKARFAEAVSS